jgi:hypothetical protein
MKEDHPSSTQPALPMLRFFATHGVQEHSQASDRHTPGREASGQLAASAAAVPRSTGDQRRSKRRRQRPRDERRANFVGPQQRAQVRAGNGALRRRLPNKEKDA